VDRHRERPMLRAGFGHPVQERLQRRLDLNAQCRPVRRPAFPLGSLELKGGTG